ncbi:MAG: transcription antitermination factor NusB, partial [Chloroflexota bacterium]|nr:transcription antitermination factor NusB [Chloroflexota bacterium]
MKNTRTSGTAARRHQGRMLSLQVLYEIDLTAHDPEDAMDRAFAEHAPVAKDVVEQVRSLVRGVVRQRVDLDPLIAAAAPARTIAEQAAIERNVLRLAVFELLHVPRVPPKVAINEAVELAKRFGGENSGKFVNGVLRTIFETHPRAEKPHPPAPLSR